MLKSPVPKTGVSPQGPPRVEFPPPPPTKSDGLMEPFDVKTTLKDLKFLTRWIRIKMRDTDIPIRNRTERYGEARQS